MKTLLFTCGVLALLGCRLVDAQAQTVLGQSWIVTSSALYRDAGQFGESTVISSMPGPPEVTPNRDDTGLIQGQGDGAQLERDLAEQVDNAGDRNLRVRDRGWATCAMDDAAANGDPGHRDEGLGPGADLFDELELVLAFAERPAGSVIPEAGLRRVRRICPGDETAPRYLLVSFGKTLSSALRAAASAGPTVQQRPLADRSAAGS